MHRQTNVWKGGYITYTEKGVCTLESKRNAYGMLVSGRGILS
jgi:hypothetical protein